MRCRELQKKKKIRRFLQKTCKISLGRRGLREQQLGNGTGGNVVGRWKYQQDGNREEPADLDVPGEEHSRWLWRKGWDLGQKEGK